MKFIKNFEFLRSSKGIFGKESTEQGYLPEQEVWYERRSTAGDINSALGEVEGVFDDGISVREAFIKDGKSVVKFSKEQLDAWQLKYKKKI